MARRRLSVALLIPRPCATEVDGLRRGFGDRAIGRIPPHITLIPPVNVRDESLGSALGLLRHVATETLPFELSLGPPGSFLPHNPVVYLKVAGDEEPHRLRDAVRRAPFDRDDPRLFVPHVTIATGATPKRIEATIEAMADFEFDVRIDRLHLLEMVPDTRWGTRWIPIADYAFEPRRVVARGGLELELTRSTGLDPEGEGFEIREWPDDLERALQYPNPMASKMNGFMPVVIVARRKSAGVVGVARGWTSGTTSELESVLVAQDVRGQGIGRHLLAAFDHMCSEMAGREVRAQGV